MRVNDISEKFYSLLGLCQKAGKLVSGGELCEDSIRSGQAKMVIISKDASERTIEKMTGLCRKYNIDLYITGQKELLGKAIGKSERAVLAVTDNNFMTMLTDELQKEIRHGGDR